jgi:hypothetical protein
MKHSLCTLNVVCCCGKKTTPKCVFKPRSFYSRWQYKKSAMGRTPPSCCCTHLKITAFCSTLGRCKFLSRVCVKTCATPREWIKLNCWLFPGVGQCYGLLNWRVFKSCHRQDAIISGRCAEKAAHPCDRCWANGVTRRTKG